MKIKSFLIVILDIIIKTSRVEVVYIFGLMVKKTNILKSLWILDIIILQRESRDVNNGIFAKIVINPFQTVIFHH